MRHLGHRLKAGKAVIIRAVFYVYILESKLSGHHYVGYTQNIAKRLAQHNSGANSSTRNKGPWVCIFAEEFTDKRLAWLREKQIKSYKGGRAFKALIQS